MRRLTSDCTSLKAPSSKVNLHLGVTEGGKESETGVNDEMCLQAGFMLWSVARCNMWPTQGKCSVVCKGISLRHWGTKGQLLETKGLAE